MSKFLTLAGSLAFTAVFSLIPTPSFAGIEFGACCHKFLGCCPPSGDCRPSTPVACSGPNEQFMGNDTDCIAICTATTTTTLPPTGACCHHINGCCDSSAESKTRGLPGPGSCRQSTFDDCNGIVDNYEGDGTTCEEMCPLPTTTTTLPLGACCEPGGACLDVIEANCVVGDYQGDGTECETVECPQPTTTTAPDTTTTTEYLPPTTTVDNTTTTTVPDAALCGDANNDGGITSVDALIALRTSVGTSSCPETRCDYNGNGNVQSSDALAILRVSVGQNVAPNCPPS